MGSGARPFAFGVLMRARARMAFNAVRAAPGWQRGVIGGLSLFAVLLFLVIAAACAGLVRLGQDDPALIGRVYEYLFFFLLAGSVPFVAATLFQADDLPLLLSTPASPRALVAAKLVDAALVNAAQFLALGVPVLAGVGWAADLSPGGWLWLLVATVLLLALAPAITAAFLLALARVLGMRRVRLAVLAVSVGLGVGMTGLAVVGVSRATQTGALNLGQLQRALRAEPTGALTRRSAPPSPPDGRGSEGWLPSAWAAAMLDDTAGGQALGRRGAEGFGALLALTAAFVVLCLGIGPGVLASEAFLENPDVGQVAGTGGAAAARTPVLGLVVKDGKYIARDLILLGQLGTTLILFFVPFLLNIAQESITAADKDIVGDLALGMLGLIAYMLTSILSLTSVGLEGRGGWIVLASPLRRGAFLRAKWLLSFGLSWATVAALAVVDGLAFGWGIAMLAWVLAALGCACFALSGLGVGLSGLFPRFVYENPAHRASVWALILGFVLATGYLIACGLMAGVGYTAVTQGALPVNTVLLAGVSAFVLVSAATGLIPIALAARRLRDYEWEI